MKRGNLFYYDLIYKYSAFDIASVNSTFKSIITCIIESLEMSKSSMKKFNSKSTTLLSQKSTPKRSLLVPTYFSSQYFPIQDIIDFKKRKNQLKTRL